jgi:hypothetical protein
MCVSTCNETAHTKIDGIITINYGNSHLSGSASTSVCNKWPVTEIDGMISINIVMCKCQHLMSWHFTIINVIK